MVISRAVDDYARFDGLSNCLTELGNTNADTLDVRQHTNRSLRIGAPRSTVELEAEFNESWMAYREVTLMAEALFREGFTLLGLDKEFDHKRIQSYIEGELAIRPDGSIDRSKSLVWGAWQLREKGDLFGGAALFPLLADGMDPIEPLNVHRIQRVEGWIVFDRDEITPVPGYYGRDLEPEYYMLSSIATMEPREREEFVLRPGAVIHASRLWVHKGRVPSRREQRNRNHWGVSVLELNERERRGAEEASEYLRTYAHRASWLHLSIAGLTDLLKAKDDDGNPIGEELLRSRMRALRKGANTFGLVVTDGGRSAYTTRGGQEIPPQSADKLESVTESIGDLSNIERSQRENWAAGTGFTQSIASGEAPSGLRGGDNEGDWQKFEGDVRAQWRNWGRYLVNWQLEITFAAKEGPTGGRIPEDWTIEPRPLRIPSEMETAQLAKIQAETDEIRIRSRVAKYEEVREQRLVKGDYSGPLSVDPDATTDTDTGVEPAQVGVAQAALQGGIALAANQITEGFLAMWLQSIDEERFPPAKAQAMAHAAVRSVGQSVGLLDENGQPMPGVPATEGATQPAPAGPDPTAGQAPMLPADQPGSGGLVPTADAAATPTAPDAAATSPEPDPEPDPLDVALEQIPTDLMTPEQIVADIQQRTGMAITKRRVTALAKRYGVRPWGVGNAIGYSLHAIKEALARDNGLMPEPATDDPEEQAAILDGEGEPELGITEGEAETDDEDER